MNGMIEAGKMKIQIKMVLRRHFWNHLRHEVSFQKVRKNINTMHKILDLWRMKLKYRNRIKREKQILNQKKSNRIKANQLKHLKLWKQIQIMMLLKMEIQLENDFWKEAKVLEEENKDFQDKAKNRISFISSKGVRI